MVQCHSYKSRFQNQTDSVGPCFLSQMCFLQGLYGYLSWGVPCSCYPCHPQLFPGCLTMELLPKSQMDKGSPLLETEVGSPRSREWGRRGILGQAIYWERALERIRKGGKQDRAGKKSSKYVLSREVSPQPDPTQSSGAFFTLQSLSCLEARELGFKPHPISQPLAMGHGSCVCNLPGISWQGSSH